MNRILSLIFHLSFVSFGTFSQTKEEIKIQWPSEYQWKVGSDQETAEQRIVELVPGSESVTNWTIIGTTIEIKGIKGVPMDVAMNLMFDQAKQQAIDPQLSLIDRNDTTKHPWIIFKIEAAGFKNDKTPESQLYYIRQGNMSLFTNFVARKQKSLSPEFVEKWAKIFKNSEIVSK